jgi:hypothetical protein
MVATFFLVLPMRWSHKTAYDKVNRLFSSWKLVSYVSKIR